MLKVDLCLDPFFIGATTPEKIKKVHEIGYQAVEFWYWDHEFNGNELIPQKKNVKEIASICEDLGVKVNDIVVNAPDGTIGGFLTKPEDKGKYLARLKETIQVAHKLGCKKLITCTGNEVPGKSFQEQFDSIVNTLSQAADITKKEGITLVLEALNSPVDHPGYYLTSATVGFDIVKTVNSDGLKLLYDIYHMQIMKEDHLAMIIENIDLIGHFHSAGVPGRNEIYKGEINYLPILEKIADSEYEGYFGLEYWATENEEKSLRQTLDYLKSF